MESNQNNPQNPNAQNNIPPLPSIDLELRSYFLQQGQSINKLNDGLRSNLFLFGMNVFLSVLLQICCYILFAYAIFVSIRIPTILQITYGSGENLIREDYSLLPVKIFIAIIALPVLACALLLGKNRRKRAKLREAFSETEVMKKNFDQAIAKFRF